MSESSVPPLRRRLRLEADAAILRAAERAVGRDGVGKVSMQAIAREAGVAVGTLYNHFGDRDGLLKALVVGHRHELSQTIEAAFDSSVYGGVTWGVVTNKPEYLASEVLRALDWQFRCKVLVGGDSLTERKPHPLPLLHAAQTLGVEPADCVYVGDDERDIEAARAAGMPSIVALWGYRLGDDLPRNWGGDVMVDQPGELLDPARWARRAAHG